MLLAVRLLMFSRRLFDDVLWEAHFMWRVLITPPGKERLPISRPRPSIEVEGQFWQISFRFGIQLRNSTTGLLHSAGQAYSRSGPQGGICLPDQYTWFIASQIELLHHPYYIWFVLVKVDYCILSCFPKLLIAKLNSLVKDEFKKEKIKLVSECWEYQANE